MNGAPWWFVLVTAIVSGGAAISAQWVSAWRTSKHANERLRYEHEVERRSRLYDRRAELYNDVSSLAFEFTTELRSRPRMEAQERAELPERLSEKWLGLIDARARLFVLASAPVIIEFHKFATSVRKLGDNISGHENTVGVAISDMEDARLQMLREIRRDLEATEPLPDSLRDGGDFRFIAPLFEE